MADFLSASQIITLLPWSIASGSSESGGIPPGSKVLEIGPGQVDFTVALADAVGPTGYVVAVDNAPPDYGMVARNRLLSPPRPLKHLILPWLVTDSSTIGTPLIEEAQAFSVASPLGDRIGFVRAGPLDFLSSAIEVAIQGFDFIVFYHCSGYFNRPNYVTRLLKLARSRVCTGLIAEYSLSTSLRAAVPHVLSALVNNTLESLQSEASMRNIRSAQTPPQIIRAAEGAGWAGEDTGDRHTGTQTARWAQGSQHGGQVQV
ncbi:hypothetical protein QBC33DRAFT_528211 [Phialemonium atrogriseum]|uniref:Methyltransferase domain-containing protein n=1 Tax=Phialemonium atrogriseum TaxID=1093897 RepID=A0AAJ0C5T3_9PEZI|nr:uncharacterized protein QBC33DRAFT_528211 [Phialemonium atrogriseum]KAK1770491.1 hypothetical protein QBC33DRAFT_528211 [Phialemonium atrogriseum]